MQEDGEQVIQHSEHGGDHEEPVSWHEWLQGSVRVRACVRACMRACVRVFRLWPASLSLSLSQLMCIHGWLGSCGNVHASACTLYAHFHCAMPEWCTCSFWHGCVNDNVMFSFLYPFL